ncbi:agmatine deiminase family protein [Sulfurimonas sp. MAG313]|nr:agmatine deiminase family protein [Sulfurimonas sp. MAG313]MDF1882095.1 agmatine deiminase family protein [Sulfurimonas sp. MAG313]
MRYLPAEFEEQSFIQIIFPHSNCDWEEYLEEAEENFIELINTICLYQDCLVICDDRHHVASLLQRSKHLYLIEESTNDTWARDCSALCIYEDNEPLLLDFTFTAWGGKFEADLDNKLSQNISNIYNAPMKSLDFILEGGAVESNGKGILLTTQTCIFNPNRNQMPKQESIKFLKKELGVSKVLSLKHGYLKGDDTDSHIDTLARFVDESTIFYLQCEDKEDEHYDALFKMQEELRTFTDQNNKAFTLIPLPFTSALYDEEERLPATYANFLILNKAVLVPIYDDINDQKALNIFKKFFVNKDIIPINCSTLIRQHGSLHCVTMQFPKKLKLRSSSL